jgi:hypothetical protein
MRKGTLHKTPGGWIVKYSDYAKNSDGTAYGSPIPTAMPIVPDQIELCNSIPMADGLTVSFDEDLTYSDREGTFARLITTDLPKVAPSKEEVEREFLETLREFAWEMWKAGATAEDQRREFFDKFYTDYTG